MHCATFFNFCLKKFRYIFNHFYTRLGREKFKNYVTFWGYFGPPPPVSHSVTPDRLQYPLQILCHTETNPPAINAANVTRICNISGMSLVSS